MALLETYFEKMQAADAAGLADLFCENGVLHDTTWAHAGGKTMHLVGRMAVEMMFHHKFGFNGGKPFPIHAVKLTEPNIAWYYITINGIVVPAIAYLSSEKDGKIDRLNILTL